MHTQKEHVVLVTAPREYTCIITCDKLQKAHVVLAKQALLIATERGILQDGAVLVDDGSISAARITSVAFYR